MGKRLRVQRASATCDHRAPRPLLGPWTAFQSVQSRSPQSATKGISCSDPRQFSHPRVISAIFIFIYLFIFVQIRLSLFYGSRALRPSWLPSALPTASHSNCSPISLWVGSLPLGDSPGNLGITLHPAARHRLLLWASGFPSAGVPVPRFLVRSASVRSSASSVLPHPRGAQTPPSRVGCGPGRWVRPLLRPLWSSRVARKALKPFH